MSIVPVGASQALVLAPDAGLAGRLALGQLIQGKVLQHFEGNRYLVRFLGGEHVVESASALRAGEVFYGRVVGLDDRVELERLERDAPEAQDAAQPGDESWSMPLGARGAEVVDELFRRYRASLEPAQAERLRRAARGAARPERMALAGLVLAKAGLPIETGLLQSMYAALEARSGALAPLPAIEEGEARAPAWWPPAQCVLNAQGEGPVAHRVGTLPLRFGEALIEVEAALFEEHGDDAGRGAPAIRHRKLVLALDTERLGRVELRTVMAEDHLRVALATERSESTNALLRHGEGLSQALADAGWQVDEISYETRARFETNAVVGAAAEHLVTPGSVSRLL